MKKLNLWLFLIPFFSLSCLACGKDNSLSGIGNQETKKLPGTIYWNFAGEAGFMDFGSGKADMKMTRMGTGSSRYDSFDMAWDNQHILFSMDVEGAFNFDKRRFVLRDKNSKLDYNSIKDGKNKFDIEYEYNRIGITNAKISPNQQYLALESQYFSELPVTIIKASNGNYVSSWYVKGVDYLSYGAPVWTKDNTLYFRIGNSVYQCSPDNGYQSAPKVLTLDGISYLTVNPQGTKFAFRKNRHLWMCNIDGSNLQQITNSQTSDIISYDGEHRPTFSPDGQYIAFTGATKRGTPWSDHDYPDGSWVATVGGKYGYIVIIPADGKLYDLDQKDNGSIWLKEPGSSNKAIPCSDMLIWR